MNWKAQSQIPHPFGSAQGRLCRQERDQDGAAHCAFHRLTRFCHANHRHSAIQLFVDPEDCIDCGACIPICTSDAIHALDDVPDEKKPFVEKNASFFKN
jgi:NAD-dependent dihydropyrimidine dehydrogenase PreA subunit